MLHHDSHVTNVLWINAGCYPPNSSECCPRVLDGYSVEPLLESHSSPLPLAIPKCLQIDYLKWQSNLSPKLDKCLWCTQSMFSF